MTSQSEIFGGGGQVAYWPRIQPPKLYPQMQASSSTIHQAQSNIIPGFLGDGDRIFIPDSPGDNIFYYNAAGSSIWNKTIASLGKSADKWTGFFFRGNLLYLFTCNTAAAPDAYIVQTVDIAGTVVDIGDDQNNFVASGGDGYNLLAHSENSIQVLPHPNDTNLAIFYQYKSGSKISKYLFMDLTTGDFTGSPVFISNSTINSDDPRANLVITEKGAWISKFSNTVLLGGARMDFGALNDLDVSPINKGAIEWNEGGGMLHNNDMKPIYYQNDSTGVDVIVFCDPLANTIQQVPRTFGRAEYHAWVDAIVPIMRAGGLTV